MHFVLTGSSNGGDFEPVRNFSGEKLTIWVWNFVAPVYKSAIFGSTCTSTSKELPLRVPADREKLQQGPSAAAGFGAWRSCFVGQQRHYTGGPWKEGSPTTTWWLLLDTTALNPWVLFFITNWSRNSPGPWTNLVCLNDFLHSSFDLYCCATD